MAQIDGELPEGRIRHRPVAHYHGDTVRSLFVVAALILIVAETANASLPLDTIGIIVFAVVLVIAAGITNPVQAWIHYLNTFIAIFGTVDFGLYAIGQYHITKSMLTPTYLFSEGLALLFLAALYYTTKTVRGIILRSRVM